VWLLLAMTVMRRGQALALQRRDVDFDEAWLTVRRAAKLVKGEGERIQVGKPKTGRARARVIDLDPSTLAVLRAHRALLATVSLSLARDDALVLGTFDGSVRHPERSSRTFRTRIVHSPRPLSLRRVTSRCARCSWHR
jgi:integrase